MGPKAQKSGGKPAQKLKEKIVEDKTFGLKNKKGAKQQKYIERVVATVSNTGKNAKEIAKLQEEKEKRKLEKLNRNDELKALFKPVVEQKAVPAGVDPKSIVCAFHKQGICTKGDKCKFSHDLTKVRQSEKRSVYTDVRTNTMENWNETQLNEVVTKKHGEANTRNETSKICKAFLDAVEKQTYGWFWECPNGNDKCIYRHCLPEGYALKRDKKVDDTSQDIISLEDLIETERAALMEHSMDKLTKVTLETFLKWKKRKLAEKNKLSIEAAQKKKTEFSQGEMSGLTGKDMFDFNPTLAKESNDQDDGDDVDYNLRDQEDDEYSGFINDIDFETFLSVDGAIDENLFLNDVDLNEDISSMSLND